MPTAKLINCPKCGASVEAAAAVPGSAIECTYCGSSIAIEAPRPPPQAPPPQIKIVVSPPAIGAGHGARAGSAIAGLVITFFVLAVVGFVTWNSLRAAGVAPSLGPTKLPATCSVNGKLTIEDQDVKLTDTAITASVNCKIFVRRSKITAPRVIEAGPNAEITIEDSTLVAESIAIDASSNAKVKITGKSVIKAEDTAIKAGTNAEVRLDGTEVESDDVAIEGSINARLDARNAKIKGKTALNFTMNGDVTLRDTELEGAKKLGMNTKLKEK